MSNPANVKDALPWGRFKLISKEPSEDSDHIYFTKSVTKIGRNPSRADVTLDMLFVSGIHCIVTLEKVTEKGEPIVMLQDLSRNGIYVNEVCVGKPKATTLQPNITIHFTKPGLQVKGIPSTIYKFEILKSGLTQENEKLRKQLDQASRVVLPSAVGKKHTREEGLEVNVEVTRQLNSPHKRPRKSGENDDILSTAAQIQKSNQNLRVKLQEASKTEVELKETLNKLECDLAEMDGKVKVAYELNTKHEAELQQRDIRLADREKQIARLKQEKEALQQKVEQLQSDLQASRSDVTRHQDLIKELQTEHENFERQVATMTSQSQFNQTKIRTLEEQLKTMHDEKKKIEMAIDSVQTRTEQVEEGKRGAYEENIMLKARLSSAHKILRELGTLVVRGCHIVEEDSTPTSQELEDIRRQHGFDHSFVSSDQSIPTPAQDHYCADTQPEMDDEVEQTMDQDAIASHTSSGTRILKPNSFPNLFSSSISAELVDTPQQQHVEDTPMFPDGEKSSFSDESSVSSHSKTPPVPPAHRAVQPKIFVAGTQDQPLKARSTDGIVTEEERKSGDRSEEKENNSPSTHKDLPNDLSAQPQQAVGQQQQGWLKLLVRAGEEENAESPPSASETGGIFDDETQLEE